MFSKYTWLFILLPAVCVLYACSYRNEIAWNLVADGFNVIDVIYSGLTGKSFITKDLSNGEKVFTTHELQKYRNIEDGLYIAILGKVYDVTEGKQYYAPGETYHAFTGRDASLAFITGEFNDEGLSDDISSLTSQQIKALDKWADFYSEKYIYKGKLLGRYYKVDGSPAADYYKLKEKLKLVAKEEHEELQKKQMFPPCNIEWETGIGTRVWCTKKSGGIDRDWVGVPRMLYESPGSNQYRCACINLNDEKYQQVKGNLREYKDCQSMATSCLINTDN